MQNTKQIKIGAMLSYFAIILNVGAGLLYTPWMVRMIGQSQYGLYTLANSLLSLFLVDFGLSSATARYVSKYRAENDILKVNNFLGIIYKLYLIIDGIIFSTLIVVYFFIDIIYKNLTPIEIEQFKVVYIIAGLFSVINFPFVTLNGILTAYEEFIHLKLSEVFYRLFLVAIMIVVLLHGGRLYPVVVVNAAVGLAVIVYKFIVIKAKLPINVNFHYRDSSLMKELFGFSAWSTVSTLAQRLVFSITPTVLGIVANSTAIAVFGIVSTIEGYVFVFTTAINGMFMPAITRAFQKPDAEKELNPLFIGVGKFQYAINGLIVSVFFVVGMQFIELWMGNEYITAYYGILLTIIPGLFYNSLQIANTSLIVTNKVKYQACVNLFMGVINIVLAFVLSKRFGVLGACISIFIAFMVRNVLLNIICYKVLKLDILKFIRDCYIRMSIPICISVLIGFVINRIICPKGWMDLIIRGAVVSGIFVVSLFLFGLNKLDRKFILQYLRHRGEK
ncbi:oligosaccharide flippase family protein [Streptococcus suis]|uniref:Oligosaccharide flippase family protein n=1 Tax=Streptococcus suis TaxID=1307 RepID=A0A0F6UYC4_STRSU|nr:oligosaccharide flippase family protein [Streptococcus suis]AKE79392.1 wzx [Streptococcus suis]AKE79589.1 wzx [Streptococcus suis]AKE80288.1 wzx [Streptococcus suis]MDG4515439.1 oligosaccharide flippase family protein [Streptococcus suis]NQH65667.1 oligosaccharide flippase family protein [Streptococcus suis]